MLSDGGMGATRHPYWAFSRAAGFSGLKSSDTAYGFFGRAAYEGDDMVAAGLPSKLAFHSKNQCGVLASATLNCVHLKAPSANTFYEVQNLRDHELIKSPPVQGRTMGHQRIQRQSIQVLSSISST